MEKEKRYGEQDAPVVPEPEGNSDGFGQTLAGISPVPDTRENSVAGTGDGSVENRPAPAVGEKSEKRFWDTVLPEKPRSGNDQAERLRRVARINAFGDFVKHLGAFAGHGYAPTERRQENAGVLRAFQELDSIRDVHDVKSGQAEGRYAKTGGERALAGQGREMEQGMAAARQGLVNQTRSTGETGVQPGKSSRLRELDQFLVQQETGKSGSPSGGSLLPQ